MSLPTCITRLLRSGSLAACCTATFAMLACSSGSNGVIAPPEEPPPGDPQPIVGLDQRPDNTTCVAPDRTGTEASLSVTRVFPALTFETPVAMLQAPGDEGRWFVVEQTGRVRVFANDPAAASFGTFVDFASRIENGGEKGLLGMAFHPDFPSNPRVYLSYTAREGTQLVSRISELRTGDGGLTLDPQSERILLSIDQPQDNHNGGGIAFGPDGYLYIGLGDGGGAGDTGSGHGSIGNGQDLQTLLGKILRIDVNTSTPGFNYAVPPDNPFAGRPPCGNGGRGTQPCPEIFAYGFRNPWRWSFDRETGALWVGDVGQSALEEIDRVTVGGNYGWRCREGSRTFNSNCGPAQNLIDPIVEYERTAGISVTGGYVYRGTSMPSLRGRYVFGDFGSGRIWHVAADATPTQRVTAQDGLATQLNIASFAEDNDGELYVVHHGGTLHRLQQRGAIGDVIPQRLSETGCVDSADPTKPAGGLIPYEPAVSFWADGADQERWIGLPNAERITVGTDGDWEPPNGSVLVQHLRLEGRLIETRLLMRHPDGEWGGYTYEWNAQQTEATRVIGGRQIEVSGRPWIFPSEAQCLLCHTAAAGRALGLETAQLNRNFTYPQTGRTANQVVTLDAIGALTPRIIQPPDELPSMPDPYGKTGTLNERARAWLHTNCSHCHRPASPMAVDLDLRYSTPLAATGACNALPQRGNLGIANALIIAPGEAERSVLLERVSRRDAQAMPPLGSAQVDIEGVALLAAWIDGLTSCD